MLCCVHARQDTVGVMMPRPLDTAHFRSVFTLQTNPSPKSKLITPKCAWMQQRYVQSPATTICENNIPPIPPPAVARTCKLTMLNCNLGLCGVPHRKTDWRRGWKWTRRHGRRGRWFQCAFVLVGWLRLCHLVHCYVPVWCHPHPPPALIYTPNRV